MKNFDAPIYTAFRYVFRVGAAILAVISIDEVLAFYIVKAMVTAIKTTTTKKPSENDPR